VAAKLNATGDVLLFGTLLGGSGNDHGYGIAVDGSGNAYIAGSTTSTSGIATTGAYQTSRASGTDAFVAKLNATGSAEVYGSYLGGSGDDVATAITVNGAGNAYVAGYTSSTNFPTASAYQSSNAGGQDAFLAKLNTSGSGLAFSTYYGGSGDDSANSLVLDSSGNIFVAGSTASTNLPTVSPYQSSNAGGSDAFVAKFNSSASSVSWATYLGGSAGDSASGVAVGADGKVYVTGTTSSTNFPTASATQSSSGGGSDAFVSQLSSSGSTLPFSTYLGGSADEQGNAIAVDAGLNIYITGTTASTDFPTVNAYQSANAGNTDAFIVMIYGPPPVAADDSYGLNHDSTLSVAAPGVLANDTPPGNASLTAVKVSNPSHGTVVVNADGSFTYKPNVHYTGSDAFTYYVASGTQHSNTATVSLSVTDTAPTATSDSYTVVHDQTLSVEAGNGVLANDTDADLVLLR
jgi:hypothetical protein